MDKGELALHRASYVMGHQWFVDPRPLCPFPANIAAAAERIRDLDKEVSERVKQICAEHGLADWDAGIVITTSLMTGEVRNR